MSSILPIFSPSEPTTARPRQVWTSCSVAIPLPPGFEFVGASHPVRGGRGAGRHADGRAPARSAGASHTAIAADYPWPPMPDAIVIGAGHNGLVAAAYLARAGLAVEVLERNPMAGGAVASEELTEPGFIHDTFSSWHPLFKLSAAFAELDEELAARGLSY